MRNATHYKKPYSLFKATIKCLESLEGCKKGWWLQAALYNAKEIMKDMELHSQLLKLIKDYSPTYFSDLRACC